MAKSSSKKMHTFKAPQTIPLDLDVEIKAKAFEIYAERVARGESGDETGDWLKAEAEVKRKHGL
jgi:hypothetical protein